jgi:hypothetical protein
MRHLMMTSVTRDDVEASIAEWQREHAQLAIPHPVDGDPLDPETIKARHFRVDQIIAHNRIEGIEDDENLYQILRDWADGKITTEESHAMIDRLPT